MGRVAPWLLGIAMLSFGTLAEADTSEVGLSRPFGIGGSLGTQVFSVAGLDSSSGGVQLDFLQLHLEAGLTERLGLGIWLPVSEMLINAAASEFEELAIRSSAFVIYRPAGDHGLFVGPGLGVLYVAVEEGSAVGPELGLRVGYELSSPGRGFSTTFGIHPYYAFLPVGSAGSVSMAGIGFEIGFHYFSARPRS